MGRFQQEPSVLKLYLVFHFSVDETPLVPDINEPTSVSNSDDCHEMTVSWKIPIGGTQNKYQFDKTINGKGSWTTGKVINPKYYKYLKKDAHQSHLGRQKMGWFLAD